MSVATRLLLGVAFFLGACIAGVLLDRSLPFQTAVITSTGPMHPTTVLNIKTHIPQLRGGFFRLSIPKTTELLGSISGVQAVQLERVWMGRQLRIRITPDPPVGRWSSSSVVTAGGGILLDDWTTGLPIISAPTDVSPADVVKAISYAQAQFARFNETISSFEMSPSHQVCLTAGSRRIQVGPISNLAQSLQRFLAYRAGAQDKHPDWNYMDLRYNAGYVLRRSTPEAPPRKP